MFRDRRIVVVSAALLAFGICDAANANSISPYVWFWPGILHVAIVYSFPASLLASVIERGFLRRAGFRHGAFALSLRANLISTLLGIAASPVAVAAIYSVFALLWCVVAFIATCAVEIAYLRWFARRPIAWRWLVLGNAFSAGVLMLIPAIAEFVKERRFDWAWGLRPYEYWNLTIAFLISAGFFVVAFFYRVRRDPAPDDDDPMPISLGETDDQAERISADAQLVRSK